MTGFYFEENTENEPETGIEGYEDIGLTLSNYTQVFADLKNKFHNAPVDYDFYVTDVGVTGKNLLKIDNSQRHHKFSIHFQDGPIEEVGVNGCTEEHLLRIVLNRLNHLQEGDLACHQFGTAIVKVHEAMLWLALRKKYWIEQGAKITY